MAFLLVLFTMIQIEELYKIYKLYPSVQTDTRLIKDSDLFFALKGPNFNGNKFADQALQKGAAYAIVDEALTENNSEKIILVNNVLETLQQLAKTSPPAIQYSFYCHYRKQWKNNYQRINSRRFINHL